MDYAKEILLSLILEEVEQDKVAYAIRKRHEISFRYDSNDGDPRGKKERITVQPVALGTTKSGNPCFRAYQINGSSESAEKNEGQVPGWRLFLLDRVVPNTWKDTGKVFNEPPMFNPNGDDTMAEVMLIADFKGSSERYERGGLKKYNQERHAAAVEKNPFYDFEKQVRRKQMAPDFVQRNIAQTAVDPETRNQQWLQAQKLKGNQQSIQDMSRQKDFGEEGEEETIGPIRKGEVKNATKQAVTAPSYKEAQQNGPVYKAPKNDINKNEKDLENGYTERSGESTEDDVR